jgi:hypothetical protein
MDASFGANEAPRRHGEVEDKPAASRQLLLGPQLQVTVLEHAFRALRDDLPDAGPEELLVHARLRSVLLQAAVAQFASRCNGLARAGPSGGTLLLTEECGVCGGWRITRFDSAMNSDGHVHYDDELQAIRALLIAAR